MINKKALRLFYLCFIVVVGISLVDIGRFIFKLINNSVNLSDMSDISTSIVLSICMIISFIYLRYFLKNKTDKTIDIEIETREHGKKKEYDK